MPDDENGTIGGTSRETICESIRAFGVGYEAGILISNGTIVDHSATLIDYK